jgi:hypothetical protein
MLGQSIYCGSLLLFATAAGCTATASTGGSTCSIDSAVAGCTANASGYSCTGSRTPEQSNGALSCSTGTAGAAGATLYCCIDVVFTANNCGPDATVTGCVAPSIGFSCTSGNRPEQSDSSLRCSSSTRGSAGSKLYCCDTAGTEPAACARDANVACTAGATGYTCPSGAPAPASLDCGAGVAESDGATGYCCTAGTTGSSTCGPNSAIACVSGATGYSCTGTDAPWQASSSLVCEPAAATGATGYCCVTSGNSCVQAPAAMDCPFASTGVACLGADTAMGANSSLLCAADQGGGAGEFCCAMN